MLPKISYVEVALDCVDQREVAFFDNYELDELVETVYSSKHDVDVLQLDFATT